MAASRQYRKGRSPHPGVWIRSRKVAAGLSWRATYVDPDSEREVFITLPAKAARTIESRRAWAIVESRRIATRRAELEGGAARATKAQLDKTIDRYFEAHPQLAARTVQTYRSATDKFEAWAASSGVRSVDDLTRATLLDFRAFVVSQPKMRSVKAGKRGEAQPSEERRSPVVVNRELRNVRTVLGYLHDLAVLPRLDFDDLRRGLKKFKENREPPEFLSFAECGQLLRAALAHDAERYTETRMEHFGDGRRSLGTTARYEPIAPFVATVLLTGMRVGEALALRWSWVHLDLQNSDGKTIGEIRLPADATKTAQGRVVGLEVCPMLRDIFAALKEQAGEGEFVFGGAAEHLRGVVEASRKRLVTSYKAPPQWTWKLLRSTCATVSTNAASMWSMLGHSAPYASSERLGHAVTLAQKRYWRVVSVAHTARTLEAAMMIEDEVTHILARVGGKVAGSPKRRRARPKPSKVSADVDLAATA